MGSTDRPADSELPCPICGRGTLVDFAFDERPGRPRQEADSHQVEVYSCGHEVRGPSLATADADRLDVERRTSEETAIEPDS
jgi:hypothetical protein